MKSKLNQLILTIVLLIKMTSITYALQLKSAGFNDHGIIPKQFTCDGSNQAPALQWQDVPNNTQSFALIVTDPKAASGIWYHWLVFNIPSDTRQLNKNNIKLFTNINLGKNSWQHDRYEGPCPPKGQLHQYIFTLYALDIPLELPNDIQADDLLLAMQNHILATATWQGQYQH